MSNDICIQVIYDLYGTLTYTVSPPEYEAGNKVPPFSIDLDCCCDCFCCSKGGKTIKRVLQKSNPTASVGCESGDCLACKGGRRDGGVAAEDLMWPMRLCVNSVRMMTELCMWEKRQEMYTPGAGSTRATTTRECRSPSC